MTTTLAIDPNVRVERNETYAGFEDVLSGRLGDVHEGDVVTVTEPESGLTGQGTVSRIDSIKELVYIAVDWKSLSIVQQSAFCTA
ncbi:hypothetical protein [Rhodococcus artemisiae]|uniref:Uncharacterized protein n=1 Tax=Rhodococcus artemisiae TaxID=714159 RepID=A0ABU7L442_9NOCA|nr:hypothetical protein [Rhodococcus artemisiae]MEE2056268.1 hypothetical protein [Rhodococcus artemisiae]